MEAGGEHDNWKSTEQVECVFEIGDAAVSSREGMRSAGNDDVNVVQVMHTTV